MGSAGVAWAVLGWHGQCWGGMGSAGVAWAVLVAWAVGSAGVAWASGACPLHLPLKALN